MSELGKSYCDTWVKTVNFAMDKPKDSDIIETATEAGISVASLKRKVMAIQSLHARGFESDTLCFMGQAQVLSAALDVKEKELGPVKQFRFQGDADLVQVFSQQMRRLESAIGAKSGNAKMEFINSMLVEMSDEELRHMAGQGRGK